jgi:RimJ/RimL family protein N-acetyltransferase
MEIRRAPRIETRRLLLEALGPHDARAMYAYRSDPAVTRYQSWRPVSEEEVEAFIQKTNETGFNVADSWFQLGVYLKGNRELIGDLGLHFLPPGNRQVEIGITIRPTQQRRGYAAEAAEALIEHVFGTMRKHRIMASVDPENSASLALLEKLGMRKEAHFRQSIWIADRWEDDVVYAVLNVEWNERMRNRQGNRE